MASGDLSHKLKTDSPYGFVPEDPVFDQAVTRAMASGDFLEFLTMAPALGERAAECGLRSFQIMAGHWTGWRCCPGCSAVARERLLQYVYTGNC